MKLIEPYSSELRELKQNAVLALDKPLLEALKEMEGKPFIFCESFQDALMATTSTDQNIDIVESTELKEVFNKLE